MVSQERRMRKQNISIVLFIYDWSFEKLHEIYEGREIANPLRCHFYFLHSLYVYFYLVLFHHRQLVWLGFLMVSLEYKNYKSCFYGDPKFTLSLLFYFLLRWCCTWCERVGILPPNTSLEEFPLSFLTLSVSEILPFLYP